MQRTSYGYAFVLMVIRHPFNLSNDFIFFTLQLTYLNAKNKLWICICFNGQPSSIQSFIWFEEPNTFLKQDKFFNENIVVSKDDLRKVV
jgi:hypothetical protein